VLAVGEQAAVATTEPPAAATTEPEVIAEACTDVDEPEIKEAVAVAEVVAEELVAEDDPAAAATHTLENQSAPKDPPATATTVEDMPAPGREPTGWLLRLKEASGAAAAALGFTKKAQQRCRTPHLLILLSLLPIRVLLLLLLLRYNCQ
jgi:hypothetical protein